jgi:glycosyltransferase involved in cell wall biosynthesis
MRISTIMPVYNVERYIAAAIESVLAQTMPSDEIIVVDDGSTDGTPDVLRTFADRIRIISQRNCGPSHALNVGIAESTGDALAFLDGDDLWLPEKLLIQNAVLSRVRDLDAVFGFARQFVSPDLDPAVARECHIPDRPQPGITKNTLLIRRSAFDRIGHFDERLTACDFVDWYARASVLGLRWRMLEQVVMLRRHHSGNTGRLLRSKQHDEILLSLKNSLDLRRRK